MSNSPRTSPGSIRPRAIISGADAAEGSTTLAVAGGQHNLRVRFYAADVRSGKYASSSCTLYRIPVGGPCEPGYGGGICCCDMPYAVGPRRAPLWYACSASDSPCSAYGPMPGLPALELTLGERPFELSDFLDEPDPIRDPEPDAEPVESSAPPAHPAPGPPPPASSAARATHASTRWSARRASSARRSAAISRSCLWDFRRSSSCVLEISSRRGCNERGQRSH